LVVDVPVLTPLPPLGVVLVLEEAVLVLGVVTGWPVTANGPKNGLPSNGTSGGLQSPQ
jgi:hypothetical protein